MSRLLIFLAVISFASCSSHSSKDKPLSSDLVQLENEFTQAMKERDRTTLERVVTPEFTVTGLKYIDSAAVTRSVWMTNILQDLKIDSARFLNVKSNTIENVGIVRARLSWNGSYGDQPFADTTSFVDTWVKTSGDWRIVSRVIADQ
ncbi:MAG: nuclear transport factor 2 family protein [Flavisolibacter sp.]